jgi:hypothetical protein
VLLKGNETSKLTVMGQNISNPDICNTSANAFDNIAMAMLFWDLD